MRRRLELRHFAPLAGFVLPTVVIGYGVVIPRSCIAGLNEPTLGFAATVVGACLPPAALPATVYALRSVDETEGPIAKAGFAAIRSTEHSIGKSPFVCTEARCPAPVGTEP